MITVFDKETGETVQVSEADAQAGFQAGRFGLPEGPLNLVDSDGSFNIDSSQAAEAFAAGARLATDEEVQAEREREEFGSGTQRAIAGVEALGRGLTLGLSTAAEVAAGVDPEEIRKRQEHAPESTLLELTGAAAPVFLSGGTGALGLGARGAGALARAGQAARVAGAIPRGVAGLGRAVEAGARGVLGEGVLARAGASALGGAAEGALAGAGQGISEALIEDKELTAEHVLASAARGAAFGGAASGLLTGVGVGAAKTAKAAARKAFSAEALDGLADKATLRQFGPNKGQIRKALRDFGPDANAKIGKVAQEEGLVGLFGKSREEIAEAVRAKRKQWGDAVGDAVSQLDDVVDDTVKPSAKVIGDRLRKEVIEPLKKSSSRTARNLGRRVEGELSVFVDSKTAASGARSVPRTASGSASALAEAGKSPGKFGFRQLHQMRKDIDAVAFPPGRIADPTPFQAELQKARRILEDELEKSADAASDAAGDAISSTYRQAKEKFAVLRYLDDVSQQKLASELANRTISLTDTISFGGGLNAGAMAGLLLGDISVVGGLMVGALSGLGAGAVNKFIREQGDKLVATGANRLLAMRNTSSAVTRRTENAFTKFASGARRAKEANAVSAGGLIGPAESKESREKRFESRIRALESAVSQDLDMTGLEAEAPETAAAIQQTMTRSRSYLASVAPRVPQLRGRKMPLASVPRQEQASFLRKARVADDFSAILDDVESGTVTPEGVEAAKAVYPKSFAGLQRSFRTNLTDEKIAEMTPAQRLQASMIMGEPVHFTLEPGFVAAAQAVFQSERGGDGSVAPSQRSAPNTAHLEATRTDSFGRGRPA